MENTMLIIDDNYVNRQVLNVLFEDRYMILEAENGKQGLEILETCNGNIDVVLLDLRMPGMDGLDVLKLRQEMDCFRNVPVIIITSSEAIDDQIKAFQLGANDFITKPFVPEIVSSRVNNVMAAHQRLNMMQVEAASLKIKSEIDEMTKLFNKTTTERMITDMLTRENSRHHALMVIDIDNFKAINDKEGHLAGDHTIRIIADTISGLFRKADIVGRIGGDEFAVMMINIPSMDIVRKKADELVQDLRYKPNLTLPANVSVSIGIAQSTTDMTEYSQLFALADVALYEAKKGGKARFFEYGTTPYSAKDDKRGAVLLVGRNRSVCSTIHSLIPDTLRIVEALEVEQLDTLSPDDVEKIRLVYVDISELEQNEEEYWQTIQSHKWLKKLPILAICEEGNLAQYRSALLAGVADILSTPIDAEIFTRRTQRHLENDTRKGND